MADSSIFVPTCETSGVSSRKSQGNENVTKDMDNEESIAGITLKLLTMNGLEYLYSSMSRYPADWSTLSSIFDFSSQRAPLTFLFGNGRGLHLHFMMKRTSFYDDKPQILIHLFIVKDRGNIGTGRRDDWSICWVVWTQIATWLVGWMCVSRLTLSLPACVQQGTNKNSGSITLPTSYSRCIT